MSTNYLRLYGAAAMLAAGLTALCAAALSAVPAASAGATFELVTESEAQAWNNTAPKESTDFSTRDLSQDNGTPTCHSVADNDADNPKIRVIAPILEKPLIAPIDIELKFVPVGSTRIRPETFRVCYLGLIAMDITKRITDRVTVSEQGLRVTGAELPRGHHRLLLLVADQHGRLARLEAAFNVL